MTRQSWDSAAATMTPEQQESALAAELARADVALAMTPRSRRWRRYRAEVWAALMAVRPVDPEIAAMSLDDVLRELQL